jgi:hypothetical protein
MYGIKIFIFFQDNKRKDKHLKSKGKKLKNRLKEGAKVRIAIEIFRKICKCLHA